MVEAVRATDFLLGRDEWGADLDRRYRETAGGGRRRVSAIAVTPEQPHADRVRLRFSRSAEDQPSRRRASPPGRRSSTRRAGTASPSTRPAAATERARSARCASSPGKPRCPVDPRAFSVEELKGGWRLACRAPRRRGSHRRGAAAADASEGGARRRRAARHPAPGGPEALPGADRADARGPDLRPRARARGDGRRRAARAARRLRGLGGTLREADWKVTAVARRRPAHRRRAGRHSARGATRSRSTSARPPSSPRCSTSRPGQPRRSARC